ncbi:MAG: topoisomerase [Pedobacter sp.]|nr:topoisomerase [Pedobacter sp.]
MLKLRKNPASNDKYTPEELSLLSLDEVKKLIVEQIPAAFEKKTKVATKKTKVATKKPATGIKSAVKKKAPAKK